MDETRSPYLTEAQLRSRWLRSSRTLMRWRQDGSGPPWSKIGGRIVYLLEDIFAYEAKARHCGEGE